jgi:putative acetyltransferase
MFDAVRNGPSKYTDAQRAAWVPVRRSGAAWDTRLAAKDIVLGRNGDRIFGFMSIQSGGYIDFAYIRPQAPFD